MLNKNYRVIEIVESGAPIGTHCMVGGMCPGTTKGWHPSYLPANEHNKYDLTQIREISAKEVTDKYMVFAYVAEEELKIKNDKPLFGLEGNITILEISNKPIVVRKIGVRYRKEDIGTLKNADNPLYQMIFQLYPNGKMAKTNKEKNMCIDEIIETCSEMQKKDEEFNEMAYRAWLTIKKHD